MILCSLHSIDSVPDPAKGRGTCEEPRLEKVMTASGGFGLREEAGGNWDGTEVEVEAEAAGEA